MKIWIIVTVVIICPLFFANPSSSDFVHCIIHVKMSSLCFVTFHWPSTQATIQNREHVIIGSRRVLNYFKCIPSTIPPKSREIPSRKVFEETTPSARKITGFGGLDLECPAAKPTQQSKHNNDQLSCTRTLALVKNYKSVSLTVWESIQRPNVAVLRIVPRSFSRARN